MKPVSHVTPEMASWALELLPRLAMGETATKTFGGIPILARAETHTNGTKTNPEPHPHKGISLYELTGDEAEQVG